MDFDSPAVTAIYIVLQAKRRRHVFTLILFIQIFPVAVKISYFLLAVEAESEALFVEEKSEHLLDFPDFVL